MLNNIKQELIEKDEDYIILKNGDIVDKSSPGLSLDFSTDNNIKVVHIIDKPTKIIYNVHKDKNIKISEIFYSIQNSPKIIIEIIVQENGSCDYISLRKTERNQIIKANVNAIIMGGAYLNYKTLTNYIGDVVNTEDFILEQENANINIQNVLINTSTYIQEYNTNILHNKKSTSSQLMNYGICKNNSELKINSKGIISQGAHNAQIRQKSKGLLLDEHSILSANPLLEIDDFDVVANHGASIGAIDEDELYYLMSRGLTMGEAEKLIINGFINPVLLEVNEGKFQDYILSWINLNL